MDGYIEVGRKPDGTVLLEPAWLHGPDPAICLGCGTSLRGKGEPYFSDLRFACACGRVWFVDAEILCRWADRNLRKD